MWKSSIYCFGNANDDSVVRQTSHVFISGTQSIIYEEEGSIAGIVLVVDDSYILTYT